jgi:RNA polymerase sigma-70 factor, ECF subfamily
VKILNTADLVEKAKSGDEEAFIELIDLNKKPLYYTLKKYLENDEDIADISQNSILKAFKYIKSLKDSSKFKSWFLCIAMNEAKLFIKSRTDTVPIEESDESLSHEENYERVEMKDIIERLESDLKDITDMHYMKDISVKDISKVLNMPVGTVKYKLHQARKQLSQMLSSLYKK